MGRMLNEINILHKLTYFSNRNYASKEERRAQSTQSLFLLTILCGKLMEFWNLLQKLYFKGKLTKDLSEYLSDEADAKLSNLKRYFSGAKNTINRIRNKVAFHFDHHEFESVIDSSKDEDDCEFYISEAQGNCLYYYSTVLLLRYILELEDNLTDTRKAFENFFSEILDVTGWALFFLNHSLVAIAKKNNWENVMEKETISLSDEHSTDEIFIPYFVNRSF
jgi:hypothetical protein